MAKELGFDATYLTLWSESAWADVPKLAQVRERFDLDVAGVYVALDVDAPADDAEARRIVELLERLEGTRLVEAALLGSAAPGDPDADDRAAAWIERLLAVAEPRGITLALYPHAGAWLERGDHVARLCQRFDHPLVRAVFTGYHWYAAGGGVDLGATLDAMAPYLASANVCGASRISGWVMPARLERLDEGELDNFAVLGGLRRVGYEGAIGLQGYAVAGDAYANLRRSLAALRDIERRLDAHPEWAALRPEPLPLPSGAE
jgi:sugar phosphate isomerase/epimerase